MCDYCGEQRSMVYCRSDAACLCLSCDRNVHSANALSKRHSRTLLCERCNSQPAFVRCVEENLSLCQSCDWIGHGGSSYSGPPHKKQTVNCYSGCPSADELSTIWSFISDIPSLVNSTCEQELGSMVIADNSLLNLKAPAGSKNTRDLSVGVNDSENVNKSIFWKGCSTPQLDYKQNNVDQSISPTKSTSFKVIDGLRNMFSRITKEITYCSVKYVVVNVVSFDAYSCP